MRQLILVTFIGLLGVPAFSQTPKREIHKGNELYQQQKYPEAEAFYKQSVDKSKESLEGNFNLGDAWYKQKKYDDAIGKFTDIAANAPDKGVKAQAYHNLGNALLSSNKLEESIAAYKKSLMNNPKDEETRYNLAYAQEKLRQQQQQNKDNKNNKDNKDNKNNKDNKDQQNKDNKDQQDKNNKDQQDKDNKDQQDKDKNKDPDKDNPDKDQQNQQQPKPDQLSKEDAERLLDALNQEEKKTQDKLKDKKAKGVKGRIVKQW